MERSMASPSPDNARQFALMLQAGLPANDAITYFPDAQDLDNIAIQELAKEWVNSPLVAKAEAALNRGEWVGLAPLERIKLALERHYAQMAYMLYTHNFAESRDPNVLTKLERARVALELKIAGQTAPTNALASFYDDVKAGRITIPKTLN